MDGSLQNYFLICTSSAIPRPYIRVLVCVGFVFKLLATWMYDMKTSPRSLVFEAEAKKRVAERNVQPRYVAE